MSSKIIIVSFVSSLRQPKILKVTSEMTVRQGLLEVGASGYELRHERDLKEIYSVEDDLWPAVMDGDVVIASCMRFAHAWYFDQAVEDGHRFAALWFAGARVAAE